MPTPPSRRLCSLRGLALAASLLWLVPALAATAEALRPEVAKPLQAAQDALKAGKPADALARVREAEAVPNRSEYELFFTHHTKGVAALAAKDTITAQAAFEAVVNDNKKQQIRFWNENNSMRASAMTESLPARRRARPQRAAGAGAGAVQYRRLPGHAARDATLGAVG